MGDDDGKSAARRLAVGWRGGATVL